MKEQYLVQYQNESAERRGFWMNAVWMMSNQEKRYANSLEEAKMWLEKAIEDGKEKATKTSHIGTPPFSIECGPCKELIVTKTRIRKRMVTEWEEV